MTCRIYPGPSTSPSLLSSGERAPQPSHSIHHPPRSVRHSGVDASPRPAGRAVLSPSDLLQVPDRRRRIAATVNPAHIFPDFRALLPSPHTAVGVIRSPAHVWRCAEQRAPTSILAPSHSGTPRPRNSYLPPVLLQVRRDDALSLGFLRAAKAR